MFSLLRDPNDFNILMNHLHNVVSEMKPDVVIGLDSRGFLFAPQIALKLNIPFVPIRKGGKLPGSVEKIEYALEYGKVQSSNVFPQCGIETIPCLLGQCCIIKKDKDAL